MAKGFSVGSVADVLRGAHDSSDGAARSVCLRVIVDETAPRDLVCAVRDALVAERVGGEVSVRRLARGAGAGFVADACVVVCGDDAPLAAEAARAALSRGVPVALLADSALSAPRWQAADPQEPAPAVLVGSSPETATSKLAEWLVGATDKHLALAANFPFCRGAEATRLARECALRNVAVGAVELVPGADFPVMCVSQAKMALDIDAAWGEESAVARVLDVGIVLACGVAWRSLARHALALAPGAGAVVRGGVAYAGTRATARLLRARLDGTGTEALGAAGRALGAAAAAVSGAAGRLSRAVPGRAAGAGAGRTGAKGASVRLAGAR